MSDSEMLIRHIALCKIKDGTDKATVEDIVKRFFAMKDKIDVIHDMEHSVNIGDLELANGFNHIFMVMFKTEADRDSYLPHEAHVEFGNYLGQFLDKTVGVDFWTNKSSSGSAHGF